MLPTTRREIYKRLSSTHGDRFLRHLFCICMLTIMFTDFGKMIFVCNYWWRQIFDLFHDHHDCCLCWHHDQDDLKKVQRRLQRSAEARWYLGKQHLGERGIRRNLHHHHECLPPLLMTRHPTRRTFEHYPCKKKTFFENSFFPYAMLDHLEFKLKL